MTTGHLSEYFQGIASKRLSAVEAHPDRSNQHEFNGVQSLKGILGPCSPQRKFDARFLYLSDEEPEPIVADGFVTWYDARESHPTRSECRLYFPSTEVSERAAEGDLLVIALRPSAPLLMIIADAQTTFENQIRLLFNLPEDLTTDLELRTEQETDAIEIDFVAKLILEQIGVEVHDTGDEHLDAMLQRFGGEFPPTRAFSEFARGTIGGPSAIDDPDGALLCWMDQEERLFRTLERYIVADRLRRGFGEDVDAFISFSLSVQNRRKSRAGHALENHLEEILIAHCLRYSRGKRTENQSRPDFLFPGVREYHDPGFKDVLLTMLGVKSTCKDRWRQVLAEANRVRSKHLLTLEPGISENQTNEMRSNRLQLVLPRQIHATYSEGQRRDLIDLRAFLELVLARQQRC